MKKQRIVYYLILLLLLGVSGYSFYLSKHYHQELKMLTNDYQKLTDKFNIRDKKYQELEEKLMNEKSKNNDLEEKVKKISKDFSEIEQELSNYKKELNDYRSQENLNLENQSIVQTPSSPNVDPISERDAFAATFRTEHGREPSSGEIQMYWLRKQGLAE
ncbi:hypothetical protein [Vagococcus xieshaowenii]|uniref:Uncharacterized protein n=1 Tax=Vagococcus xieshaowenii TaxID=2562451 RepID=A0A4Z0D6R6_9ENTE|nr:hypothetical protein [Vagococcus xieshaowenii]QCA28615.1 hypothetical protein E4Z98_04520 [Vagococcus xieshaowenii]TFZ40577.1 hypothetical protein E4031_07255 [Vagococcus xieshaowenii]